MDAVIKALEGILAGGTTDNIIKGILILLLTVGIVAVRMYMQSEERKKAAKETQDRANQNQTQVDSEAQTISQDAQDSERRIDEIMGD